MLCPQLVKRDAHNRLAVPLRPLREPSFAVDVVEIYPLNRLLGVELVEQHGARSIHINTIPKEDLPTLYRSDAGVTIAIVTTTLEIFEANGSHFGTLVSEQGEGSTGAVPHPWVPHQYQLRDNMGRLLLRFAGRRDGGKWTINSPSGAEHATVVRQPAGASGLPAEHYEVVANPNVDAVLILSGFLALQVFEMPRLISERSSTVSLKRLSS